MGVHRCNECSYQTERMYNLKVHQKRKHKHMGENGISTGRIGHAGVVYQNNIQPSGNAGVQQPLNQPVVNPVYTEGYYQQPENAQPVYHQAAYLGEYDQGGYLSDDGTQTSVQSDDEEPDILDLLTDIKRNFNNILYIKTEYRAALPGFKKLGDRKRIKFLKNYAEFKVQLMDHYKELEQGEMEYESEDTDSDGEGSMDMDDDDSVDDNVDEDGHEDGDNEGGDSDGEDEEDEGEEEEGEGGGDVKSEKGDEDVKKRFFDFIFEAGEYFDEQSLKEIFKFEEKAKEELRMENLKLNKESLRDRINLLNIKHKGVNKMLYIRFCSDDCIHAISECCHNILDNSFDFDNKQLSEIRKKLKPITRDIRRLANPSSSINRKRKILQKPQVGDGVLGIIASLVIPTLMKLFVK